MWFELYITVWLRLTVVNNSDWRDSIVNACIGEITNVMLHNGKFIDSNCWGLTDLPGISYFFIKLL
jgi:hypothetical protein